MKKTEKNTNKAKSGRMTQIVIKDAFTNEIVIVFKPCKQKNFIFT